jgi:hypothetical protein
MANYNGLVASLTLNGSTVSQTLGTTAVSKAVIVAAVPNKYFSSGQFAVQATQGVSGGFAVVIVGAVGGATYIIAGRTNITAAGGWPVPPVLYVGTSGSIPHLGFPRPSYVSFEGTGTIAGFTAGVFLAGEYD